MDIATLLLSLGIDPGLIIAATGAVTLASGIDALFPPSAPGSAWYWPRRLLSLLALNVRHARNAGTALPSATTGPGRPPAALALALALVAALGLAACSASSQVKTTYALDNAYFAALATWGALDKSGIDSTTVADINAASAAAYDALVAANKAVCPEAFTTPVGSACTPGEDATVTAALEAADAAVTAFKAVVVNHATE